MPKERGRRRLTCHHEAGHALTRWYFGHRTDRVVVLTVEEVRAGVQVENGRGVLIACEGLVDAYDICGYPYGPLKIAGTPAQQADCDRRRRVERDIELINCHAGFSAEAHYLRVSPAGCMFAGGLQDMEHAQMLLKEWDLTGDARAAEGGHAQARATALVRSRSGAAAIRAMADALMEHGEIDGERVGELCRPAYGGRECEFGAWAACWPPTLRQIRDGHIPEGRQRVAA